jgi:putative endonuclease
VRFESGRHRIAEKLRRTKHVVAAGNFVRDAGSTPAASSLRSEHGGERRLPRRNEVKAGRCTLGPTLRTTTRQATKMKMDFCYVYILQSEADCARFYVGLTNDLKDRLRRHNAGEVPHTSKFKPWRIKTAIAFADRQRAAEFERYLKTASGRAFAKKRL